MSRVTD